MTKCEHNNIESECSICRHANSHNNYHLWDKGHKKQLRYYDLEGNPI